MKSAKVDTPEFGPRDPEGFRTISFYKRDVECLRVSLHFERFQAYLQDTALDCDRYSSLEQECFKAAAKKLATQPNSPLPDEREALSAILLTAVNLTGLALERSFPAGDSESPASRAGYRREGNP